MTTLRALWHRARRGHARQPWAIEWENGTRDERHCRVCVLADVRADIRDSQRPWGRGF